MSQQQEPPSASRRTRSIPPGASESSPPSSSTSSTPSSSPTQAKQQQQHIFASSAMEEDSSESPTTTSTPPPPPPPHAHRDLLFPWYRAHFSCQEIGRYFPSTKRHLTWIVGFEGDSHQPRCKADSEEQPASNRETPSPEEEESPQQKLHRVELVWSVRSGKTRVLWDGNDITHLFSSASTKDQYETVLLTWDAPIHPHLKATASATTTTTCTSTTVPVQRVRIQIEAHADYATDLRRRPQYDLTLDGRSYRSLPTLDELRELAFRRDASNQQQIRRRRRRTESEAASPSSPQPGEDAALPSSPSTAAAAAAAAEDPPASVEKSDLVEPRLDEPGIESSRAMPNDERAAALLVPGTPFDDARESMNEEPMGRSAAKPSEGGAAETTGEAIEAALAETASTPGESSFQDDTIVHHVPGDVDELSDLGYGVGDDESDDDEGENDNDRVVLAGPDEDEKEESYCVAPVASTDFDFRLSMVGLKPANSSENSSTDVVDELRSDLYSPMLETLRLRITDHLPQLEDVVSKAIIHAFFVDNESSQHSCSGGSSSNPVPNHIHPDLRRSSSGSSTLASGSNANNNNMHSCRRSTTVQLEMDSIVAAHKFVASMTRRSDGEDAESRSDVDDDDQDDDSFRDRCLDFMQAQIDAIFCLVRNDEIVPSQAARILLRVACVLGLDFARPIPTNTVLLTHLDETVTARDVSKALSQFGEVVVTAVAPGGYGLGRFRDTAAPLRVEANRESLLVKGQVPCVSVLTSSVASSGTDQPGAVPLDETGHSSDAEDDLRTDPPHSTTNRPESPQVTIPHLMALGEYNISFVASSGALSSSSSSLLATAPNKPRPISEATTSSGSSSTQATLAMTESSVSLHHAA